MRAVPCTASILVLAAALAGTPAAAQSAKAKSKAGAGKHEAAGHQHAGPASDVEIRIFRDYLATNGVKPKPLPPGIAKNLARGKPLPPGIAKTRLPNDLLVRLPSRPNYEWVLTGDVVVLVDPVGLVVDILRELF